MNTSGGKHGERVVDNNMNMVVTVWFMVWCDKKNNWGWCESDIVEIMIVKKYGDMGLWLEGHSVCNSTRNKNWEKQVRSVMTTVTGRET